MEDTHKEAFSRVKSALKDMHFKSRFAPKKKADEAEDASAEHHDKAPVAVEVSVEKHSLAPAEHTPAEEHAESPAEEAAEEAAGPEGDGESEPKANPVSDHALAILRALKPAAKRGK